MIEAPRYAGPSVTQLVGDLELLVRDVITPCSDETRRVRFAEILDPTVTSIESGTILLGVGHSPDLAACERLDAPAIMVKHDPALSRGLRAAPKPQRHHIVLLEPGVSWFHVAGLVRERLGLGTFAAASSDDAAFGTDLFEVANAVSGLVRGPVTIEDRDFTVLAFSQDDQAADPARVATVLGRAVPAHYRELLESSRVLDELTTTDVPLYVDLGGGLQPRLAMPIRSGEELLGSMWAVVDGPVPAARRGAFADAARVVALALLRQRAEVNGGRRLRADLLADLLSGSPDAAESRTRLGLAGLGVRVLGIDLATIEETERSRLSDVVALQLASVSPATAVTIVDDRLYAVVPTEGNSVRIGAIARRLRRSIELPLGYVAVGREARTIDELLYSRRDTDRSIRVRRLVDDGDEVVFPEDLTLGAILLASADYLESEGLDLAVGVVARLSSYDADNGTDLIASLEAYFATLGDIGAAATRLHVHPNTLRYRLRRAADVSGLELDDPDSILLAWVQIRRMRMQPQPRSVGSNKT